ncbi:MAG TPA: protease pro-enzyme activation domain-containing protein [Dongiaceae bacterium]|nr:protease pro-enzyme activation domain-containing protein [Dongiaceae bacterium]
MNPSSSSRIFRMARFSFRTTMLSMMSLAALASAGSARGQSSPQARVIEAVQNEKTVTLRGNVHPWARAANDRGTLADQQPVTRMGLLLQRSAAQESALEQLLAEQQDPKSEHYHAWLTPQEFGARFGPADADLAAVKTWLASQGFTNVKVNNGRTVVSFDGTAGQVRNAFHAEIHRLSVGGKEHFGVMREAQIPAALAPVVAGVVGLSNFHPQPQIKRFGKFRRNAKTGEVTPLFTFTDVNGTFYGVGPGDFAKIYNIPAGADGSGQSIAIVGQSNINIQDVRDFRSIFGLPVNDPQIILNGPDPGLVSGDEGESDLDVEWSGAVAPKATIKFVATQSSQTDGLSGVDASALYIVDNNIAPVMSESYGSCESALGSFNSFYNSLWQQAAAQGITVVVSSGDNGAAGCDDPNSVTSASGGIAVSGIASTPFNISAGGTDFDQAGSQTTFWNSSNASGTQVSAKGYIPETTWNDSCAQNGLTGCNSVTSSSASLNIVAGSGGPSSVYSKPAWQSTSITGVPNDSVRDTPDVSLFASDGQNGSFYIVCESDEDISGDTGCNLTKFTSSSPFHDFQAVGGTSAAAPSFAAIMALVNQKTGQRQGNANVTLYALAKAETFSSCNSSSGTSGSSSNTTCVFNDVTKGTVSVPCAGGSTNCSKTSSGGFGVLATNSTTIAYGTTTGYDLATGLGSVNVANLLNKWATPSLIATTTTLTPSSVSGTVGTAVTLSGKVTKSSGSGTPSGVVVFQNSSTSVPADSASLDSNGNYSVSTAFLAAGTYNLKAHYGGDTTFAASDSPAIAVNLAKQNSTVVVSFVTSTGSLTTAAQSVAYGSPYILRVDVTNAGGGTCENVSTGALTFICPTGTIALKDNGGALNDFPNAQTPNATNVATLNDRGFAEDQPIQLGVGTHSITASYTANSTSSYNSNSSSNTLSVTITKASTSVSVSPSVTSVNSGGSVVFTAVVSSSSNSSTGPTGSVTFMNGGTTLGSATCTPTGFNVNTGTGAFCTAQLTTTISALPPGLFGPAPVSGPGRPISPLLWFAGLMAALSLALFLLGTKLAARRRMYATFTGCGLLLLAAAIAAGCGGGSSSGGGGGGGSARTITAAYAGDSNYSSASGSTSITVH